MRVWTQPLGCEARAHTCHPPHLGVLRLGHTSRACWTLIVDLECIIKLRPRALPACCWHDLQPIWTSNPVSACSWCNNSCGSPLQSVVITRRLAQHDVVESARRTWPHSTALEHGGTARLFWTSATNMRSRAAPLRTCLCSTLWDPGALSRRLGAVSLQCERLRLAPCVPRLRCKPRDRVRHRPCADDTVRRPYASEPTCRGGYPEHR